MGCEGLSQGHKAGQEDSELPNLGHRQLHLPVLVGKSLSDFTVHRSPVPTLPVTASHARCIGERGSPRSRFLAA